MLFFTKEQADHFAQIESTLTTLQQLFENLSKANSAYNRHECERNLLDLVNKLASGSVDLLADYRKSQDNNNNMVLSKREKNKQYSQDRRVREKRIKQMSQVLYDTASTIINNLVSSMKSTCDFSDLINLQLLLNEFVEATKIEKTSLQERSLLNLINNYLPNKELNLQNRKKFKKCNGIEDKKELRLAKNVVAAQNTRISQENIEMMLEILCAHVSKRMNLINNNFLLMRQPLQIEPGSPLSNISRCNSVELKRSLNNIPSDSNEEDSTSSKRCKSDSVYDGSHTLFATTSSSATSRADSPACVDDSSAEMAILKELFPDLERYGFTQ